MLMCLCCAAAAVYGAGSVSAAGDGAGAEFSTQGARRSSESSFSVTHLTRSAHTGTKTSGRVVHLQVKETYLALKMFLLSFQEKEVEVQHKQELLQTFKEQASESATKVCVRIHAKTITVHCRTQDNDLVFIRSTALVQRALYPKILWLLYRGWGG